MLNLEHFDLISVISGLLWLSIVALLTAWHYSKIQKEKGSVYFLPTFYFKILSALGFSIVYLFYYEGGDTFAYWDGAGNLTNLFYDSPLRFLREMMKESSLASIQENFNSQTGYPHGWIYREPESFFVSKLLFFLSLITFKSYWAATFILVYLSARISFYFYQVLLKLNLHSEGLLAFAVLFVPSVSFWCSGISKDTFVYLALLLVLSEIVGLYYFQAKLNFRSLFFLFLGVFLIFQIRIYILIALIPAFLVAYTRVINTKNTSNKLRRIALNVLFYSLGIFTLILYLRFSSGSINGVFEEIIIMQKDFANNPTYGDNRYDIHLANYSIPAIIRSIPDALVAALFRPYIWESRNILLLLNGLESAVFMFLTFRFISHKPRAKIKIIRNSEFLIFALVFILIMGFSVGFTSGLFGVLVRLKAVILPFLILLVGLNIPSKLPEETKEASI